MEAVFGIAFFALAIPGVLTGYRSVMSKKSNDFFLSAAFKAAAVAVWLLWIWVDDTPKSIDLMGAVVAASLLFTLFNGVIHSPRPSQEEA